jgi:hypothetical protein
MMDFFTLAYLYRLFNFGQKLSYKVWWAIGNILGNTLRAWEHVENALRI